MKQRLLVLNSYRLLQSLNAGEWEVNEVKKAGAIKPGIYNIYLATPADRTKIHDGMVLYADKDSVYQQVKMAFVRHERASFDQIPLHGTHCKILYENGQALVKPSTAKPGRKLTR